MYRDRFPDSSNIIILLKKRKFRSPVIFFNVTLFGKLLCSKFYKQQEVFWSQIKGAYQKWHVSGQLSSHVQRITKSYAELYWLSIFTGTRSDPIQRGWGVQPVNHKSQRTANAPIWLVYSLKSNFSELSQDSVFMPVSGVEEKKYELRNKKWKLKFVKKNTNRLRR